MGTKTANIQGSVRENSRELRGLAVRVLTRVLSDSLHLDDILMTSASGLSSAQTGWLQDVTAGTLRWKGRLDFILDSVALKKKPSGWLRKVLLIAVYQLTQQDRVSPAVVVSETVGLVKEMEGEAPARFANACLRKIGSLREKWNTLDWAQLGTAQEPLWASLPPWIWNRLVAQKGKDWAIRYAEASLARPQIWLRSKDELRGVEAEPGPIPQSWLLKEGGNISQKEGFSGGEWIVQDISSQSVIFEMADLVRKHLPAELQPIPVLDLCAAPGGKSIGLSWMGFQVTATDHDSTRLALLKANVARTKAPIDVVPWESRVRADKPKWVFIDAPCTGSGILRRHPDVRWLRQEKDLKSLVQTQMSLLQDAMKWVDPGSLISYSVCSVLQEEGSGHLSALEKLPCEVIQQWSLCPQNSPFGDGFWAVLLKKV